MDWDNYECEGQIDLEEYLWDSGYYMPLPIEETENAPSDNG